MNNERIDVLEVMGHAIRCVRPNISDEHFEWHRQLTEARAAVAELVESLRIAQQALLEVARAQAYGPSWYTKGESGLRSQVDMWVRKGLDATDAALDRVGGAK